MQIFGEAEENLLIGAPVDVRFGHLVHDGVERDDPVHVILELLHSGGGSARLLGDWVLVRVL